MSILLRRNLHIFALIAIVISAFGLRVAGINYYHYQDETYWLYAALKIGNLDFNYHFAGVYEPIMFCVYAFYFVIGFLLGKFSSISDFLNAYFSDPHNFFLVGRTAECIAGAAGVAAVYRIGKELFNRRIGLVAALFLSFSFVNVLISQKARGQAFASLFLLLAFYFICKIADKPVFKNYILASFFGAMAISIRVIMAPIILTLILVNFVYAEKNNSFWRKFVSVKFLLALLLIPILFIAANPAISQQAQFLKELLKSFHSPTVEFIGSQPPQDAYLYYLEKGFSTAFGWSITFLSLAGIIYAIFHIRARANWMVLSFIIPCLAIVGNSSIASYHYLFPIAPFIALLCARVVFAVVDWLSPKRWQNTILSLVSLALILEAAIFIYRVNISRTLPRTQNISKKWIFSNIPLGARIAADSMGELGPDLKSFPVIDVWIYNLSQDELKELYEQRIKTNPKGSYALKNFIENPPSPKYYLKNLGTREIVSIEEIKAEKIEYIITSSRIKDIYELDYIQGSFPSFADARSAFYDWLEDEWELIKVFSPAKENTGPEIKIYRRL